MYPVTTAGVGPATRYAVGPVEPADTVAGSYIQDQVAGAVQAAPNGRKLVFVHLTTLGTRPPLGLFGFDPVTGAVSNYVSLGALVNANSPCFSPDNTKLYVPDFRRTPNGQDDNVIIQFDLQAGYGAAIAASGQSIVAGNPATNISTTVFGESVYLLQNGPDGRIYGASGYQGPSALPNDNANVFYVIGRPNARGFACEVRAQHFDFGGRSGTPSLPSFMQHHFNGLEPAPADAACDPAQATVFPPSHCYLSSATARRVLPAQRAGDTRCGGAQTAQPNGSRKRQRSAGGSAQSDRGRVRGRVTLRPAHHSKETSQAVALRSGGQPVTTQYWLSCGIICTHNAFGVNIRLAEITQRRARRCASCPY